MRYTARSMLKAEAYDDICYLKEDLSYNVMSESNETFGLFFGAVSFSILDLVLSAYFGLSGFLFWAIPPFGAGVGHFIGDVATEVSGWRRKLLLTRKPKALEENLSMSSFEKEVNAKVNDLNQVPSVENVDYDPLAHYSDMKDRSSIRFYQTLLRPKSPLEIHHLREVIENNYRYLEIPEGDEVYGDKFREALGFGVPAKDWRIVYYALLEKDTGEKIV